MKFLFIFSLSLISICSNAQVYNQKIWSTYYFGVTSRAVEVAIDNEGNIVVVGSISKYLQPLSYYIGFTTVGAHKSGFNASSSTIYENDCTISKFSPDGNLIWATQFGGQSNDVSFQLEIDSNNNIYFSGYTASNTGVATVGAFDEIPPSSGSSKFFLTKFDTNGVQQWGTYINASGVTASICIDANDHIYLNGNTNATSGISTVGAYQNNYQNYVITENPNAEVSNGFVLKFDSNGNRLAGTYLGKTNPNIYGFEITTDSNGDVIVIQRTNYYSNNLLATTGCHQNMTSTAATYSTIAEATITKLNPSLSQIIWSTYYSGIYGNAWIFSVACHNNLIFIGGQASQSNNFATSGCFQSNVLNNSPIYGSGFIACFNSDGVRQWATYYPERVDDIRVFNNKLYVNGVTNSDNNNLGTVGSYQNTFNGVFDGYFSEFNLDGTRNWSSYFGGESADRVESVFIKNNDMYVVGNTGSFNNISTTGSIQPNLNVGNLTSQYGRSNMFLAKFNKDNLSTNNFSNLQLQLTPNPNNGQFTLTGNINNLQKNMSLLIYDTLGRQIASKEVQVTGNQINQEFNFANQLSQGLYFAKITDGKTVLQTFKVLVK